MGRKTGSWWVSAPRTSFNLSSETTIDNDVPYEIES